MIQRGELSVDIAFSDSLVLRSDIHAGTYAGSYVFTIGGKSLYR